MDTNNRLRAIWRGLACSGRYTEFVTDEDVSTFNRRLFAEGAEFYARGLTSLRTSFLAALEKGCFEECPSGFKARKGSRLPVFLYNAFASVFTDGGTLRSVVNTDAVACLNQLLAVFGKIEGGHTAESEDQVIDTFLSNEEEVGDFGSWLGLSIENPYRHPAILPSPIDRYKFRFSQYGWDWFDNQLPDTYREAGNKVLLFILEARRLVRAILAGENPREITPRHGPGASADGLAPYQRYGRPRWIPKLDAIYPYSEYFYLSPSHVCDELEDWVNEPGATPYKNGIAGPEYDPCAKVILVPKDARGPRLISCEPRETMWIQQGLMSKLVTCLEAHPLTQGLINFEDQAINKTLAWDGSITRQLATLDLKDASDRVSLALVKWIWPENWFESLTACRSDHTALPDGRIVTLNKFAPMGSALCFPVMALTIWAILTAFANMTQTERSVRGLGALKKTRKRFKWVNPVYVYGDDIIISSDSAERAMKVLSLVGLRVNQSKSFVRGSFRESCGGEYYNGWDVTPVRLRALPDDDIPSRMKVIAFHNNVVSRYGLQPYWLTELIHTWYPDVPEKTRWNLHMQYPDRQLGAMPAVFQEHGDFLSSDPESPRYLAGTLEVDQPDNTNLRSRFVKRYARREYRVLAVVPKVQMYKVNRWCQVFRAVVNPRLETPLGWDALAKRVCYKYRWLHLR